MIDARRLLADCQRLVRALEKDLAERLAEHPALEAPLEAEHARAHESHRTAQSYRAWRADFLTQVAVHWVLGSVFVRFLEDNGLVPEPWLSGVGDRRTAARDRRERFFAERPSATDRDYLLAAFQALAALPSLAPLFEPAHNPLFRLGPSADGARTLVEQWLQLEAESGTLRHDFTDPRLGTRFLGDLYQDLSEAARKRFALLQTPEFVEEFLLDRTLEPAIRELGLERVRLIDPACGSGHFLLGAFARLFGHWQRREPGTNERELARRALEQVAGVDLNPFAVAIARFRLLVAALAASGLRRLADTPAFPLHLAAGDSLLHGVRPRGIQGIARPLFGEDPLGHVYDTEDAAELRRLLGRRYSVVVGNPPYITPKDAELNQAYRDRFGSCSGKYSLAVPFTERFFDLAHEGLVQDDGEAGWVGMITTNSFMKREFGKKLIETYFPRWDLTHVIDTSGAYLPGHGTPTVILIGRHRPPQAGTVRAVMGIRGEPGTPEDAAQGIVWRAIVEQVDRPGSQSEWVSVADLPRERFERHPWSIGGGGAAELKEELDNAGPGKLMSIRELTVGGGFRIGQDEVFLVDPPGARRRDPSRQDFKTMVHGEGIRDWSCSAERLVYYPYRDSAVAPEPPVWLYPWRTGLVQRATFQGNMADAGLAWWEYMQHSHAPYRTALSIAFAFVATHNHFVLDRGGKVFNRTAPVIKLPAGATEDEHLELVGLLNSSAACFWMKQMFFNRGSTVDQHGARQRTLPFEDFWEFDSTKLLQFPLPEDRPLELARQLDRLASEKAAASPRSLLETDAPPSRAELDAARSRFESLERRMIALQEELDWQVYRLYDLLDDPLEADLATLPEVALGERAFEIALARRVAAGETETQWFARHGSTPITEIPARWPAAYRAMVERRLAASVENSALRLIEQPEHKRRWNREGWEKQEQEALRAWLLDRLEGHRIWPEARLASAAQLADRARRDDALRRGAALYRGRDDFDWTELLTELTLSEAVPYLAAWRYQDSGLAKRAEWEETWRLQRREDALDARSRLPLGDPLHLTEAEAKAAKAREVGTIPVPPRYTAADFQKSTYWRLRGQLDVPKERFLLYPGLERPGDPSPVLGWAGWTALEQAQALGTAYQELKTREGWPAERLVPLLAGLEELVPWLKQWYNDPDPTHGGLRLGDYFESFVTEESRALGTAREDLAAWQPPGGRRRRKG